MKEKNSSEEVSAVFILIRNNKNCLFLNIFTCYSSIIAKGRVSHTQILCTYFIWDLLKHWVNIIFKSFSKRNGDVKEKQMEKHEEKCGMNNLEMGNLQPQIVHGEVSQVLRFYFLFFFFFSGIYLKLAK